MRVLDVDGFARFVEAVHGHPPFAWQRRLASRLLEGDGWPALLDLPTGTGKTSVLDIAVYALAATATGAGPLLPRRIVFVVDRRVIVDQTAAHAAKLVRAVATPDIGHVHDVGREDVRAVGRTLFERVGGDQDRPLHLSVLRGGIPRDGSWALRPDQATIMVSTVDQVGSRLLFNGYGVSDGMAPVHAGLLGTDTAFFLDEVHLSRPFAQTLRTVREVSRGIHGSAPLSVVELSATPGQHATGGEADGVFGLEAEDRDPSVSPELVRRLTAPRLAHLVEAKGKDPAEAIAAETLEALTRLEGDTHAVVVNRVATARSVHLRITQEHPDDVVLLLTGRMRPLDRGRILRRHADRLRAGRDRSMANEDNHVRPRLIVVATQTIEAGADFDFDGMVTELAPIDSLRQRFGRLDRLGRAGEAGITPRVIIVVARAILKSKDPDPVYGTAVVTAHDWLREQFGIQEFDVSPSNTVLANPPDHVLAPSASAPRLLPHHVDLLVQTAPRPATQPPVELWLHGPREVDLDVTVVWRADLFHPEGTTSDPSPEEWDEAIRGNRSSLELAPPAPGEAMAVRLSEFRRWAETHGAASVLRWGGRDSVEIASVQWTRATPSVRPGDTVVVPTSWGGIRADNWDPVDSTHVSDQGLDAVLRQHRRIVIRIVPGAVPASVEELHDLRPEDETGREQIRRWLGNEAWSHWCDAHGVTVPDRLSDISLRWIPRFRDTPYSVVTWHPKADGRQLDALGGLLGQQTRGDGFDGSDVVHSFTAAGVTLTSHCDGVGEFAARFAERAGLSQHMQDDLRLAGRLHDLGKADPRFQRMLLGGWPGAWVAGQSQLAKSPWGNPGDPEARRARDRSEYPMGMRHEVASVALVHDVAYVQERSHDWDLVLHLVATHHGTCRPFAPVVTDPDPVDLVTEFDGRALSASSAHGLADAGAGIPERYWRVHDRYGPWGMAFLEAVLRLADHRRSQFEQEQGR